MTMYIIMALSCALFISCYGNEPAGTPRQRPPLTRSLTHYPEDINEEQQEKILANVKQSDPITIPSRRLSVAEEEAIADVPELESDDEDPVKKNTPPDREPPVKIWQFRSQIILDILRKEINKEK